MAVLTRTNAQLVPIQQALAAARVPFWSPAQGALLHDPVAGSILSVIRRTPQAPMQAVVADLVAQAEESASTDERSAVLTTLADLARTFQRQEPQSPASQWLTWLPTALSDDPRGPRPTDAVTLCSFHRAKGLEWDAVWVAGMEQGLVPIGRAISVAAEQEERRLLYVALTRAATELHCSWARQRTFGTRAVRRDASPWLELVRASCAGDPTGGPESPAGSPPWRDRLRDQRQQLHAHGRSGRGGKGGNARLPAGWPEPDPDLVSALRAWRSATARAAGVPAYVVLHDATLAALASRRPRTTQELLGVPGLGPVKASRYGPTLLSLLSDWAAAG